MEIIPFGKSDISNVVSRMDKGALDQLPFGAVLLDRRGTILKYNRMEQQISGRTDPNRVIGKNWFRDVAPCTRSREFFGKFLEGVSKRKMDVLFDYTFDYKMTKQSVRIHMKTAQDPNYIWVFVKRVIKRSDNV